MNCKNIQQIKESTIEWLLDGDVSIQYQVNRDLLDSVQQTLRDRIAKEGWGREFISFRKRNGHWGNGFYQPKWISTPRPTRPRLGCIS